MELSYFDKIVSYQICDFLYDEFKLTQKGKIAYQSFTSMCGVLTKKIKNSVNLNKSERRIIARVLDRMMHFFGFNENECVKYMGDFFVNEAWAKYHSSVNAINSVFYQAKNI